MHNNCKINWKLKLQLHHVDLTFDLHLGLAGCLTVS